MRSSLGLALPAVLVAVASPAAALSPRMEIIERIVAVVDERPLLLSDVRALAAVRGLAEGPALEAAIDERLMYIEAARLPQAEVTREEEDRALTLLLDTRPTLRAEVPEPDLRRLLRRQIAILKYVEFRFRPQVRVSDEEVRKAWEEEQAGRPAGPALEDEQEAIRTRLERRALDERIEAWVRELRARADVRYVGGAPPALAEP
jgi:peptidyl-prolyl cis-trans isomerase SurA